MIRNSTALAAALTLAACATPSAPAPGGTDTNNFVLADLGLAEAPYLAREAAGRGDYRLIGFIGIALVFPGADPVTAERYGYRVIDAGGDSFTSGAQRLRADRAYAFAEAWNRSIIFMTSRPD